jgi:hypothetical protein
MKILKVPMMTGFDSAAECSHGHLKTTYLQSWVVQKMVLALLVE